MSGSADFGAAPTRGEEVALALLEKALLLVPHEIHCEKRASTAGGVVCTCSAGANVRSAAEILRRYVRRAFVLGGAR